MRCKLTWAVLAAFAVGLAGCGKKTEKTKPAKTESQAGDPKTKPVVAKTATQTQVAGKTQDSGVKTAQRGNPGKTPDTGGGKTPLVSTPQAANPISTAYVTDDFIGAVVARPASVNSAPLVQYLLKEAATLDGRGEFERGLQEATKKLTVDPRTIQRVTLLIDKDSVAFVQSQMRPRRIRTSPPRSDSASPDFRESDGAPAGSRPRTEPRPPAKQPAPDGDKTSVLAEAQPDEPVPGRGPGARGPMGPPAIPAGIVEFQNAVDPEAMIKSLFELKRYEVKTHQDKKYYLVQGMVGVHFAADNKSVVFGRETQLQKMLAAAGPADTPLTRRLKSIDSSVDFAAVVDLTPFRPMIKQGVAQVAKQMPEGARVLFGNLVAIPEKVALVAMTADVDGDKLLTLTLQVDSADEAKSIGAMLGASITLGKGMYSGWSGATAASDKTPAYAKALLPVLDSLVAKAEINVSGSDFTLTINKPDGYDKLPELLKPAIEKAREAAGRRRRMNDLKQIAIALHNYHDVYGGFPNKGIPGAERGAGLSWRVHILPYIEQDELYKQFKLDEPWDSANNKALIGKMPEIFKRPGVSDSTKTSLHVFVGKDTPFGSTTTLKFSGITDGSSNTLLVVEAGPDTADVWTKPGGIEFNPDDPIKALGKIGSGFIAAMADGSVRRVDANTTAPVLKKLITHASGD